MPSTLRCGLVALAVLSLVGCSGGGSSSGPSTNPAFTADGGFVNPPSYRPCLSNMECPAFESCISTLYYAGYYGGYPYTTGFCTRGCFSAADCSGHACFSSKYGSYQGPQACVKPCTTKSECAGAQECKPAGDAGFSLCTDPQGMQSIDCRDYISCYYKTGGTVGSLDSTYGSGGTCWTTSAATADACTSACKSAIQSLRSAYPDAGC